MRLFGLTGGIGTGKSAAEQLLRDRGVAVIDTDALARRLVEPGEPALAQIVAVFGANILAEDGQLRRQELARRVFGDAAERAQLESILHPRIRASWLAQAEAWRAEGRSLAVVVIPLLFETKAQTEFHATICVACSRSTQSQRLRDRGWSVDHIAQRLSSQWPVERKISESNYMVWNESSLGVLSAQLVRVLADT